MVAEANIIAFFSIVTVFIKKNNSFNADLTRFFFKKSQQVMKTRYNSDTVQYNINRTACSKSCWWESLYFEFENLTSSRFVYCFDLPLSCFMIAYDLIICQYADVNSGNS